MKKILIGLFIVALIIAGYIIIKNNHKSKYEYKSKEIEELNFFVYRDGNSYGVIDKDGKIIINANYTNIIIPNPEKDVFVCYNNDKVNIFNKDNKELFTEFEEVAPIKLKNVASSFAYEKATLLYKKGDLYGLINFDGKIITKNLYSKIENLKLTEGKYLVSKDTKYGIIDQNGNEVVNTEYDSILSDGYFTEENNYQKSGFIVAKKQEDGIKYGYISFEGKIILKEKYNEINRIQKEDNNIYLIASENGKYGLYKNSKQIIEAEYQGITYEEGLNILIMQKNKKYGVATLDGKIIIDIKNDEITAKGIYLYAKEANENKVYDTLGNNIDMNYNTSIYETEAPEYRICVTLNNDINYYGIIDKEGKMLVQENYRYIEYLYSNYFIVSNENGALGVINSNGKIVLDIKYSSMQKIKGKHILQAIDSITKITDFFDENIEKIIELKDPTIEKQESYVIISGKEETLYIDNNGKEIKDTTNLKNTRFPDKIGDYKKEQITMENVYYIKEK